MSYILDALKKSEQERKLGNLPDISSDHHLLQKSQDKSVFLYVMLVLMFVLVIILSVLVFYYLEVPAVNESFSNDKNSVSKVQSATAPIRKSLATYPEDAREIDAMDNTLTNSGAEIIRPNQERRETLHKQQQQDLKKAADLKREYQDIFQQKDATVAAQENNTNLSSDEILPEDQAIDDELSAQDDEVSTEIDEPKWEDYQSIAALSPALKQQIPSIKVSTHIFSSVQSFRKVTVNGFSVKSGTEISEGLVVEHILEEGVIFSFQGVYFRMKALEEWEG